MATGGSPAGSVANPIREWLARVAAETGSPVAMLMWASHVKNENSRKLIVSYAEMWLSRLNTMRRA